MKKSYIWKFAALLVVALVIFSSCEEDPIVTPKGGDDDECTGSYCKIDMNASDNLAYSSRSNNPEMF